QDEADADDDDADDEPRREQRLVVVRDPGFSGAIAPRDLAGVLVEIHDLSPARRGRRLTLAARVADQEAQACRDDEDRPGGAPAETEHAEHADEAIQAGREQPDAARAIEMTSRQHQAENAQRHEGYREITPPADRHLV